MKVADQGSRFFPQVADSFCRLSALIKRAECTMNCHTFTFTILIRKGVAIFLPFYHSVNFVPIIFSNYQNIKHWIYLESDIIKLL